MLFRSVKHPYYDYDKFPYLILKDTKFISIVDVKERRVFPIIRSPFEMEHLNNNNIGICLLQESLTKVVSPLNILRPTSVRDIQIEEAYKARTWIFTLECFKEKVGFTSSVKTYFFDTKCIAPLIKNADWRNLPTTLKIIRD